MPVPVPGLQDQASIVQGPVRALTRRGHTADVGQEVLGPGRRMRAAEEVPSVPGPDKRRREEWSGPAWGA